MGRKIPARKHRGVNDPIEQKRRKDAKLKNVINAPPVDNGENEPLPKSLQEIMRLRQLVKEGKITMKKKRKSKKKKVPSAVNVEGKPLLNSKQFVGSEDLLQRGMKRPEKVLPIVQQRPWEKDKSYLYRVNQMCEDLIKETKFEKKYNVDVIRNPETGNVETLKKKAKDDVDVMLKEEAKKAKEAANPKKRRKTKKKEAEEAAAKEEKAQKKKNRRKLKREKLIQKAVQKREDSKGFLVRETVKFGDIVDRPPEIKVRPRKALAEKDLKNLKFNQMIIQGKLEENSRDKKKVSNSKMKSSGKNPSKSLLTGKRKDLPAGQRRLLEEQQKSAIAAYRLLKAKKEKAIVSKP